MDIRVQINFVRDSEYGRYSDSLYFDPFEIAAMTQEDVEAIMQERYDKWIEVVSNPPPEPVFTEEDRQRYLDQLKVEKERLETIINGNQVPA